MSDYQWTYVEGGGMFGAGDRVSRGGHGTLLVELKVGNSLMIGGDSGIVTSRIKEIINNDDGSRIIITQNSIYKVVKI